MDAEIDRQITRKAMAFDLYSMIDQDPDKKAYTKDEIKKLIQDVIAADQK